MAIHHGPKLPIQAAVTIMRGILQALTAAHGAGLIHRDLKPANILLKGSLDNLSAITDQAVKVTDFGLGHVGGATTQSIMQSGSRLTEDGRSVAGTLAYMSPEQKQGGELDARSDLYACGIVLFEMLTGDRPQGNELPRSLRPEVPAHLDEVFKRSYARCERRYTCAEEMLAALSAKPSPVAPPPPPTRSPHGQEQRCPACQQMVHRDDQFCILCGQQLVASVPRCNTCQAYVHGSDRFCIFCGNDLRVLK